MAGNSGQDTSGSGGLGDLTAFNTLNKVTAVRASGGLCVSQGWFRCMLLPTSRHLLRAHRR
jgi:hypothetical protein